MSNEYFQSLNYTLANEDTSLELALLPEGVGHVFSVAGSGGRVLPLLARKPKLVTCVDVSEPQLYLAELRFESLRALSHHEFLAFWGYPPSPASAEERRDLFEKVRLSAAARGFLNKVFTEKNWDSVLYDGKWERTFAKLSAVNRRLTGVDGAGLFTALTDREHFEYLDKRFPRKAWLATLFVLGNATVFNALLYKGHFPRKNLKEGFFEFYQKAFDRLFAQGPARRNFFLQLVFFGKIVFSEGCPIECDPPVFAEAKRGVEGVELRYRNGDLIREAERSDRPIDFFSFSDVPSYFQGEMEKGFLQRVRPKLQDGGLAVVRNYLHLPEGLDTAGYANVAGKFQREIGAEKVQVYNVDIFQRTS